MPARDAVARALAGRPTEPVEFRLRDRDGAWRAVSLLARDLRGHPAVAGTALYATDTTRARAAERRERVEYTRLMTLVESLKVGVLVQDEQRPGGAHATRRSWSCSSMGLPRNG